MGAGAQSRLDEQGVREMLDLNFSSSAPPVPDEDAFELELSDGVRRHEALKITSGRTRLPYGTVQKSEVRYEDI